MEQLTFEQIPQAICRIESELYRLRGEVLKLNQGDSPNDLLDVTEAAKYLNLAKQTVYIKVSKREIPHIKQGKKLRFLKSDLLAWLEQGRKATTKEIKANGEAFLATKKGGKS